MDIKSIIDERGSNKFKRIRKTETNTGIYNHIAISKEATANFGGCSLFEVISEQGIFLAKSGCDLNEIIIRIPQKETKF